VKRVHYLHYGAPEQLRLDEVKQPDPGRGQIRVRVKAAAANPMDWKIRRGEMRALSGFRFPRGLGHDFAGVVEAVGPGVKRLKVGDEILGVTSISRAGAFAEVLVADEKNCRAQTAINLVRAGGRLDPGERNGLERAGGEGKAESWPVGLYHRVSGRGWTFGGADCAHARCHSRRQLQRVEARGSTGAGHGRGRRLSRLRHHPVSTSVRCGLRYGGRVVAERVQRDAETPRHVAPHRPTPAKLIGCLLPSRHHLVFGNPTQQCLAGITQAAERGKLVPAIGRIAPLSEAISAIVELEMTGIPKGKLVIVPTR